jgi:hypothetical protein
MRLPKGKLLALVALVLAASMVMATGAFSTVTAERSVDVKVTGDKNAFLALQPSDGPNKAYAKMNGGQLAINLNGEAKVDGKGVNPDAVTSFDNVFTITNQGSQSVKVWIEDGEKKVSFYAKTPGQTLNKEGGAVTISPGTTKHIGIMVNAKNTQKGTQLLSGEDSVIVHAVAPDSQVPEQAADGPGGGGGGSSG